MGFVCRVGVTIFKLLAVRNYIINAVSTKVQMRKRVDVEEFAFLKVKMLHFVNSYVL